MSPDPDLTCRLSGPSAVRRRAARPAGVALPRRSAAGPDPLPRGGRVPSWHLALGSVLVALLAACSQPVPPADPPVHVLTVVAQSADSPVEHLFPATVLARHEVPVGFRVGGRVTSRRVELGSRVASDQVLGTLDSSDYALNRALAADQRQAAEVERAQAERDAARFGRLGAEGALGTAERERQQARADASAAKVAEAGHQLELAERRTGYADLRAPFAGVVTQVQFEPGLVVGEGQPVLTLADPAEPEVVADLPEDLAAGLRAFTATATAPGDSSVRIPLRLREVAPQAQPQGRTVRVRYTPDLRGLPPAARALLTLGHSIDLQLAEAGRSGGATGSSQPALALPAGALAQTSAGPFVYVVDAPGQVLRTVPVQVQGYAPGSVLVRGVAAGSVVVAAGVQKVHAGQTVVVVPRSGSGQDWAPPSATPGASLSGAAVPAAGQP